MNEPQRRVGVIGYGLAASALHAPSSTTTAAPRPDAMVVTRPDRVRPGHPGAGLVEDLSARERGVTGVGSAR
jgi:hypothetical protein